MKHTNFNMPTLRRITLFAILLLGIMPIWADVVLHLRVDAESSMGDAPCSSYDDKFQFGLGHSGNFEYEFGNWWKLTINSSGKNYVEVNVHCCNGYSNYKGIDVSTTEENYATFHINSGSSTTITTNQKSLYDSEKPCPIPTSTIIYVDVTNFTSTDYQQTDYRLSLVGEDNKDIDINTNAANYNPPKDIWYQLTRVSENIYSATISASNIGQICIWSKDMSTHNNPNEANVAGRIMYDCDNAYNLYTISANPQKTSSQKLYLFTGTWSTYSPGPDCTNCGYLGE